ncbi:hypothetical protein FNV43_RR08856 [Rhamnella rubrinervis]|uniref:Disease resistance protein At4g27190-like leucine-rich repeats domain-containing protein n=1 Tax=Rhamnella rubrinervis TaxID=2594499 RepID=A0A8K0MJR8_9ROSA|nr:hypothetical protein FNV43_RR08856 [Rhamnella rubrinervis]
MCTLGLELSLFEGTNTIEEANDRLYSSVDKLKDYCLLLDTDEDGIVTMHDLTRDVARKIASMEGHFLSKGYGDEFKEWPTKEILEKCTTISLDEINIPNLPEELGSPELQMFELYSKDKTLEIPPHFFKEMKQLKVLDLTNLCIPSLPPSVQSLSSLQTLRLDQCELRDLGIVGELRSLEILSLIFSKFKQLPKEIGQLTRLRLLDLRNCPELEVIHPNVISSLTRLEELNMNNSFNKWKTEEANNNISLGSNASLSELKHLSNLTTLGINIKAAGQLPFNFFNFFYDKLNHFKIFIGDVWDWDAEYATSKTLKLKLSQTNQWDQGLQTILNRCEDLSLDVFDGVNNIVYQLDMDGFQRLKKLHVQNNPEISHIVQSNIGYTWIHFHAPFPVLEELSLLNLISLESVCSVQLAVDSFKKLKIIKVKNCPKLKNLFSCSMLGHELFELEKIEVEDCKRMKEIVEGKEEQLVDDPIKFLGLRSLTLQSLPELISFSSNHSPLVASTSRNPMQLFNDKIVFPKLKDLILSSIPLNELWDGQLSTRLCWIQNLTSLTVEGCDGLTFLCSSFMSMNLFVQLKRLKVRRCQNMVEIISTEEYGAVKNISYMFPKLETLVLEALGKLETFCASASHIEFPCLQGLIIKECSKLGPLIIDPRRRQNVIDTARHHLFDEKVGFPRLEYLVIQGLHKLTTVWHIQLAPDSFCKLTNIQVISCSSLLHILVPGILKSLHSLKELYVEDCESVEAVFKVEGTSGGDHDQSEIFIFRNLVDVNILNCKSLKNVFPAPVARLLEKLEFLWIENCEILEQIVAEEEVGLLSNFMFPRATSLILYFLPQLRSFHPRKHTSNWPSLSELRIVGCDKLEILADEYSSFQQQQHEDDSKQQKGSFSNLENLYMTLDLHVPLEFYKINDLSLNCTSNTSSADLSVFLQKFHKLKTLELFFGDMEEIFMNEELLDGEEPHVFVHLKSLKIHGMDNLIQVWKDNSNLPGPVFPNLEILKVKKCGRLKNIVPSSTSFCNLVQLEVLECHGLKHLITCSVAKSFHQLQSIIVEDCQRMLEIVASSDDNENIDDADANKIIFSRLKDLKFCNLPNLKGFCSRNYNVKFPFLTTWSATNCIEMKISIDGVLQNDSKHGVVPQITQKEEQGEHDDNDDDFEKWW